MNYNVQWIALKVHSDWLLKLWLFFAIYLEATCTGIYAQNIVIVAGINESNSSFGALLSHCFSIY